MAYEPDTKLRSYRKNGQVEQPYIENPPDNNGWPDPLTDPSSPYKIGVTNGKNGEQSQMSDTKTSQAGNGGWSLTEGTPPTDATQPEGDLGGQRTSGDSVSQKIWSDPAGSGASAPAKQWLEDSDMGKGLSDPLKTTQQLRGEIHDPEGEN